MVTSCVEVTYDIYTLMNSTSRITHCCPKKNYLYKLSKRQEIVRLRTCNKRCVTACKSLIRSRHANESEKLVEPMNLKIWSEMHVSLSLIRPLKNSSLLCKKWSHDEKQEMRMAKARVGPTR